MLLRSVFIQHVCFNIKGQLFVRVAEYSAHFYTGIFTSKSVYMFTSQVTINYYQYLLDNILNNRSVGIHLYTTCLPGVMLFLLFFAL